MCPVSSAPPAPIDPSAIPESIRTLHVAVLHGARDTVDRLIGEFQFTVDILGWLVYTDLVDPRESIRLATARLLSESTVELPTLFKEFVEVRVFNDPAAEVCQRLAIALYRRFNDCDFEIVRLVEIDALRNPTLRELVLEVIGDVE